jgi:UDP-N-acetylmuramoylalanine--D-glutamate ligase
LEGQRQISGAKMSEESSILCQSEDDIVFDEFFREEIGCCPVLNVFIFCQFKTLSMHSWHNKKVLVMGLGIQGGGVGVARYFATNGARVLVTDLRTEEELARSIAQLGQFQNISYHLGGHHVEDFIHTDYVVKGPSIRWDNLYIEQALKKGIPVIMETAYFAKHTKAILVGVTGTRGKSTTTTCIYSTLKNFYTKGNVYISGNIPDSCAIELLDRANENDIVVLELSSWQLSGFHRAKVSPQYAVFTNIYEDHFNYYDNMQKYVYDKTAIFSYQNQNDHFITSPNTLEILQSQNVTIPSQVEKCTAADFKDDLLNIRGDHNRLNAALALKTVHKVLPKLDTKLIRNFISRVQNIKFRQEIIADIDNTTIVNDSTSTTPISVITAIETFSDKKIVLILGGNSKKLSIRDLLHVIETNKEHIHKIYLLKGTMTDEMFPFLCKIEGILLSEIYEDFVQAINDSVKSAQNIHVPSYILFSPGATSFAQFRNEFERGEKFNSIISDIIKK